MNRRQTTMGNWALTGTSQDTYEIQVEDEALDMRVGAAIGVAVDAYMNR